MRDTLTPAPEVGVDPDGLRKIITACCGFDPGVLGPETVLEDIGITGLARLWLISWFEASCGIDFPADLVGALETVDDLCHLVSLKLEQRGGPEVEAWREAGSGHAP